MNGHRFSTVEACVFEKDKEVLNRLKEFESVFDKGFNKEVTERLNDLERKVYMRATA